MKAAVFDIGNVVLFFSHRRMCRQLAASFGIRAQAVDALLFDSGFVARYDRGLATTEEMFELLARAGSRRPSIEEARDAAADIFEPNVALRPVIERLRRRGVRVVALSNTCEVHASHVLARFEVFSSFDHLVLSHEVGLTKPDPRIFAAAVQASGCDAEECFFVDDVADYVAAARRAGLDGEVFVDVPGLETALEERGYGPDSAPGGRQDSGE